MDLFILFAFFAIKGTLSESCFYGRAERPCNECVVTVFLPNQMEMPQLLCGDTDYSRLHYWLIVLSYVTRCPVPHNADTLKEVVRTKSIHNSVVCLTYTFRIIKNIMVNKLNSMFQQTVCV